MRAVSSSSLVRASLVALGVASAGGCAKVVGGDADGSTMVMGGVDARPGFDAPGRSDRTGTIVPGVCGDGMRTVDEACDDGNTTPDDGCAADCRTVDPGYSCVPIGKPCHRIARCGDGGVVLPELCDDGNTMAGDGCSATCKVELGFKCSGNPSTCTPTKCGDRIVEGAEGCDDGNSTPYDGCSADCTSEPNCTTGACASRCGDGIVIGEACDDGNNLNGDGCTSDCKIEPGFECHQPPLGDRMQVPAVYRDFRAHVPTDFQPSATGRTVPLPGIVADVLDAEGKPTVVMTGAGSYIQSQTTFGQWYRDTPGVNHTTTGKITLWNNGNGGYVNRWGPNGEPWPLTQTAYFCGSVGQGVVDPVTGLEIPCTFKFGMADCDKLAATPGYKMIQCVTAANGGWSGIFQTALVDGNPFFFPVDADTFTPASERSTATTMTPYVSGLTDVLHEAGGVLHNFHFTSEVRYWFQYDATKAYKLDFTGDDDVWVFINKKLAVDLGGIHTPQQGSVTIDNVLPANSPARFGLANGNVYEAAVFQAERQTDGSSYRLTLSGFSAAPSECLPICGDAILGIGEECDDGMNLGGYGQCGPGCKLGAFCGDAIVQTPDEECDDGVNNGTGPTKCPSGCHNLVIP